MESSQEHWDSNLERNVVGENYEAIISACVVMTSFFENIRNQKPTNFVNQRQAGQHIINLLKDLQNQVELFHKEHEQINMLLGRFTSNNDVLDCIEKEMQNNFNQFRNELVEVHQQLEKIYKIFYEFSRENKAYSQTNSSIKLIQNELRDGQKERKYFIGLIQESNDQLRKLLNKSTIADAEFMDLKNVIQSLQIDLKENKKEKKSLTKIMDEQTRFFTNIDVQFLSKLHRKHERRSVCNSSKNILRSENEEHEEHGNDMPQYEQDYALFGQPGLQESFMEGNSSSEDSMLYIDQECNTATNSYTNLYVSNQKENTIEHNIQMSNTSQDFNKEYNISIDKDNKKVVKSESTKDNSFIGTSAELPSNNVTPHTEYSDTYKGQYTYDSSTTFQCNQQKNDKKRRIKNGAKKPTVRVMNVLNMDGEKINVSNNCGSVNFKLECQMETTKQKVVTFEFCTGDMEPDTIAETFISENLLDVSHKKILVDQLSEIVENLDVNRAIPESFNSISSQKMKSNHNLHQGKTSSQQKTVVENDPIDPLVLLELQLREIIGGRKESKEEKYEISHPSTIEVTKTAINLHQDIKNWSDTPEYVPLKYLDESREIPSPSDSMDYKQNIVHSGQFKSYSDKNFKPVEPASNFSASLQPLDVTGTVSTGNVIINDTLRKLDDRHINEMEVIQKRMEELQRNYMQEKENLRADLVTSLETASNCHQIEVQQQKTSGMHFTNPVNYIMQLDNTETCTNQVNDMELRQKQHGHFQPEQQSAVTNSNINLISSPKQYNHTKQFINTPTQLQYHNKNIFNKIHQYTDSKVENNMIHPLQDETKGQSSETYPAAPNTSDINHSYPIGEAHAIHATGQKLLYINHQSENYHTQNREEPKQYILVESPQANPLAALTVNSVGPISRSRPVSDTQIQYIPNTSIVRPQAARPPNRRLNTVDARNISSCSSPQNNQIFTQSFKPVIPQVQGQIPKSQYMIFPNNLATLQYTKNPQMYFNMDNNTSFVKPTNIVKTNNSLFYQQSNSRNSTASKSGPKDIEPKSVKNLVLSVNQVALPILEVNNSSLQNDPQSIKHIKCHVDQNRYQEIGIETPSAESNVDSSIKQPSMMSSSTSETFSTQYLSEPFNLKSVSKTLSCEPPMENEYCGSSISYPSPLPEQVIYSVAAASVSSEAVVEAPMAKSQIYPRVNSNYFQPTDSYGNVSTSVGNMAVEMTAYQMNAVLPTHYYNEKGILQDSDGANTSESIQSGTGVSSYSALGINASTCQYFANPYNQVEGIINACPTQENGLYACTLQNQSGVNGTNFSNIAHTNYQNIPKNTSNISIENVELQDKYLKLQTQVDINQSNCLIQNEMITTSTHLQGKQDPSYDLRYQFGKQVIVGNQNTPLKEIKNESQLNMPSTANDLQLQSTVLDQARLGQVQDNTDAKNQGTHASFFTNPLAKYDIKQGEINSTSIMTGVHVQDDKNQQLQYTNLNNCKSPQHLLNGTLRFESDTVNQPRVVNQISGDNLNNGYNQVDQKRESNHD